MTSPTFALHVAPDDLVPEEQTSFEHLHCPACGSEWIGAGLPTVEEHDDGDRSITIPFSCSACCLRWELAVCDRKGQVAITYGPQA